MWANDKEAGKEKTDNYTLLGLYMYIYTSSEHTQTLVVVLC